MFWSKLNLLCADKGVSVASVSKAVGISSGTATGWKNGKTPSMSTIKKIADYFNVSPQVFLLDEKDIKKAAEDSISAVKEKKIAEIEKMLNGLNDKDLDKAYIVLKAVIDK